MKRGGKMGEKEKLYPPRIDCEIYDAEKGECDGLKETYCTFERCNFYKPKPQSHKQPQLKFCEKCGSEHYLCNEHGRENVYCGKCGAKIYWGAVKCD